MKIVSLIARILLGLMFTVFGANGFLHFIPQPPMADSPAMRFFVVMSTTHYLHFVFAVQLICGLLLLIGIFVPLALVVLAAVIANILVFHITMQPAGIIPGSVTAVLWILTAMGVRPALAPLLQPWVATPSARDVIGEPVRR